MICLILASFFTPILTAQVSTGFEGITTALNCGNATCPYVDPGSATVAHTLMDANGIPVSQTGSGSTLGFTTAYTPTRTITTGSNPGPGPGLTDGDNFGVAGAAQSSGDLGAAPFAGSQIFLMEDTDGLVTMTFDGVDLTGTSTPMFSMRYFLDGTSWEISDSANDRFLVRIEIDQCASATTLTLIDVDGDGANDIDNISPSIEDAWLELSANLTAYVGCRATLVIEFDSNSSSEELGIDAVSFTEGVLAGSGPVCTNPTVPTLAQTPSPVCENLPYGINITGVLNSATQWAVYSDAAANNLVTTTSANAVYFPTAVPGTQYFIRGEGGCVTPGALANITLSIDAAGNCMPGSSPGTSFEEPLGFVSTYNDTGNPAVAHQLVNNQGEPTVDFPFVATELGFQSFFEPTRNGGSGSDGLTEGDFFGVNNNATFNFPDGSQGFIIEDPDGLARVEFSPVDMAGVNSPTLSLQYFLNSASYETSNGSTDRTRVYLRVNNGTSPDIDLINSAANNGVLPGLTTEAWTTISTTAGQIAMGDIVQLIIEADFNSTDEEILFDDIVFSGGAIIDCLNDTEAPTVNCPANITTSNDAGMCSAV
ncbi:MAG: hypothetical protein AAFQ37_09440, partial [Bacteroidota bacterium]